jgi:hypothetical protein
VKILFFNDFGMGFWITDCDLVLCRQELIIMSLNSKLDEDAAICWLKIGIEIII